MKKNIFVKNLPDALKYMVVWKTKPDRIQDLARDSTWGETYGGGGIFLYDLHCFKFSSVFARWVSISSS
jgi:hypothetical protein